MRKKPLPEDPAERARVLGHRARCKKSQQRRRERQRAAMDLKPGVHRAAASPEEDAAVQAGLTIGTKNNILRPTFIVILPDGQRRIETLEPDLV